MPKSILVCIHGGESWSSYEDYILYLKNEFIVAPFSPKEFGWKILLRDTAFSLGWDVYMPEYPSKLNAHYDEWKIVFERILDSIRLSCIQDLQKSSGKDDKTQLVFVGHSLGGCFLLNYLSSLEGYEKFSSVVNNHYSVQFHSVAGCLSDGDFVGPQTEADWSRFEMIVKIHDFYVWHSEDDTIVPFSDAEKLVAKINVCKLQKFQDRFHFIGSDFPELMDKIFSR